MNHILIATGSLIIAAQSLLLSVLIFNVRNNKRIATFMLAALLAVLAVKHSLHYLLFSNFPVPKYTQLVGSLLLLIGPLLYFYVKILVKSEFKVSRLDLLHGLPVLLSAIFLVTVISPEKYPLTLPFSSQVSQTISIYIAAKAIWITLYLVASLRLLMDYEKAIRDNYSAIEQRTLQWLYQIIGFALVINIILFFFHLFKVVDIIGYETLWLVNTSGDVLLIYFIALRGYRQIMVFEVEDVKRVEDNAKQESEIEVTASKDSKAQTPKLTSERIALIWDRVTNAMEGQSLYLDSDLSLSQLADNIAFPLREVSEAINTVTGNNFYDLVNGYRAKKAKELLEVNIEKRMSVLDVGMAAGFNSNTTFYKYFKKMFKQTPSKYKKSLQEKSNDSIG